MPGCLLFLSFLLFAFSIDSSLSVATTRLYISIVLKPSVSMAEEEGEKEVESDGPEGSISDVSKLKLK